MKKLLLLLSILFIFSAGENLFCQQNELIKVIGDSLIGKTVNGELLREVYGNVVLSQGDVIITCNKAIQFLSRNEAELIGNVIAKKDTLTIKTEKGFYFGNLGKTKSTSGVFLDDKKVILTADSGEYYFNEDRAFFQTNVKLFDTLTTLTSDQLTYFQKEDRALAISNVKIIDAENEIIADTLIHFRNSKITFAFNNVRIKNLKNNTEIFGEHLEDYRDRGYSLIDVNPLLVQVDTSYIKNADSTETLNLDTLFIKSELMEAFRDSSNKFVAKGSVNILKNQFASKNDFTIFNRDKDQIIIQKDNPESRQPVIWNDNSQLTGDSLTIYLVKNKITRLDADGKAFMLSQNNFFEERYDQSSSETLKIYFIDSKIDRTEFFGNVYSIYYLYEKDKPNGLTKSNSKDAVILFDENAVSEVKLYGNPASEYYPEKQVIGNEKSYLLPRFIIVEDRPTKNDMYQLFKELK